MAAPFCATRPADWWTVGDDGNRFAALLCRRACPLVDACPVLRDGRAHGVVAAGIAWSDFGQPLRVCGCGRPIVSRSRRASKRTICATCDPPWPQVKRWRPKAA